MKDLLAVSSLVSRFKPAPESTPFDGSDARARWRRAALIAGASLTGLLVVAGGGALGAYVHWASQNRIAPNVFIAGQNVGGLTSEQAQRRLRLAFGRQNVALEVGNRAFDTSLGALGGKLSTAPTTRKALAIGRDGSLIANISRVYGLKVSDRKFMLPIEWNKRALVKQLKSLDAGYRTPPRDARLVISGDGSRVVPDARGRALNIGESARLIQAKYYVGARGAIALSAREVAPKLAAADLRGDDVLLGTYRTGFNSGLIGRTTNIRVACATIDGRVLMPGEEFSFNQSTKERTWKRGYRMAHIFERKPGATESEVVDGLAGGVCQVSSTLFNAVRKANQGSDSRALKIVERSSHSLPVTYVPRGLDATVAWPHKDFRFRNTLPHPVWLRTKIARSRLRINVWGRVPDAPTRIATAQ